MTRWKLRIAGGLTLLSLLALSPPSTRAGWRTKAEQRPKEPPTDCQFGYYGTGWRAWPEGCRDGLECGGHSLPYATPFVPSATPLPPSWSNQPWTAPTPMMSPAMPPPTFPTQAAPSPWSTYREYLAPQNNGSMSPIPQQSFPPSGALSNPSNPQFAPPKLPAPIYVPSQPPISPTPTLPPPVPPMSEQRPTPPAPQAIRNPVPPLPTTTRTSAPPTNVQQIGAWNHSGSKSQIITLGAEFTDPAPPSQRSTVDRLAPQPSFSSVPKSLIGPKDASTTRPQRGPNPVMLMSPE